MRERALDALEEGRVIHLPRLAFALGADERAFVSDKIAGAAQEHQLRSAKRQASPTRMSADSTFGFTAMDQFGRSAERLVRDLLPKYAAHLQRGRVSFRPSEMAGRAYSPRKDDTRLHVDAFPSRPLGGRLLRVFANVAGDGAERRWRIGEPFPSFAKKFVARVNVEPPGAAWLMAALGVTKGRRTAYDHFMLSLHDMAKLDADYQANAPRADVNFASGEAWLCFTDQVLHAALAGHAALEQTFYLPVEALARPSTSPLRVLEGLTGRRLI